MIVMEVFGEKGKLGDEVETGRERDEKAEVEHQNWRLISKLNH